VRLPACEQRPAVATIPTAGTEAIAPLTQPPDASPRPGRWLRGLEVDLRSLALFRVGVGLVLLADLLLRLPLIPVFYSDGGILPREAILRLASGRYVAGLYHLSGSPVVELLVLLAAVLFAVGFTAGYRTRLCAVVSWLLLISLHARNPLVLHGGDAVLRLLLFWSIFAPVHARFSLDKALNPSAPVLPVTHLSPATLAIVFQVCGIYWFAAAEKMHPVWVTERSALYYALSLDQFATPLGKLLLDHPAAMRLLTSGTLALELLGPLLAISPFFTAPLRLLVAGSFIGFHLGLAATMWLDLFPWICIAAWCAFLPGVFWERVEAWWAPTLKGSARVQVPRWLIPPAPRPLGLAGNLALLFFLLLSTASFVGMLPGRRTAAGAFTSPFVRLMLLDQTWRMFAPYPSPVDGWFVIEGVTDGGRRIDIWNGGGPATDEKPADFRRVFRNTQWGAYLTGLRPDRRRDYRPYFGRYLCRAWNERHQSRERVRLVAITYMVEVTPPPGSPPTGATPEVVWHQPCE
jgi:hypothetical protein